MVRRVVHFDKNFGNLKFAVLQRGDESTLRLYGQSQII